MVKEQVSELGAEFGPITDKDRERLKIDDGVQVINLTKGKLKDANMKVGFIITDVNKVPVSGKEDIERILMQADSKKTILFEGLYPNGEYAYYILNPAE